MADLTAFEDYNAFYAELNRKDWIPIYEEVKNETDKINDIFGFSALIDNDQKLIEEYLRDFEWGFSPSSFGKSTFERTYSSSVEEVHFLSGDKKDRIEYLVAYRTFNSKYPNPVVEINPELIWYYNLVQVGDNYVNPDTDEILIKKAENKILVQKSYLRDFLSAYNKCCIICFDHRRFYSSTVKPKYEMKIFKEENLHYSFVRNSHEYNKYNAMSSILGKVIIKPYTNPKHEDYEYLIGDKLFENFIINEDEENGNEVEFTCNEEQLANYFGKNPEAPHFLTPVYFERKVLDKYNTDPTNYTVGDGVIIHLDKWSIPFTINGDERVVVWLGDLGRIPYLEQKHWRIYNTKPQGGIETKFFQRQMMAQFTDAITPEKKLFELIGKLNVHFINGYEDKIIYDLSEADRQIMSAFAIPSNNSITQYQTFLMQLCKITVENINTKLIKQSLPKERLIAEDGNLLGSRLQLKVYLIELGINGAVELDKILKVIYNSRNKLAGHKGSIEAYNKVWNREVDFMPNFISDSKILLATLNNALNDIIEELESNVD